MANAIENEESYILFIDLKAAFDSVDHEIMFEKLKKHDVSEDVINSIKFIYSRVHTQVDINTPPIPINKGVLQGGILSPILFNIYINDLVQAVHATNPIDVCAYADDIAVLCAGRNSLTRTITTIKEWCKMNRIDLNAGKSGVMRLKKKSRKSKFTKEIDGIPVVHSYK